jgi:hypothetical protein
MASATKLLFLDSSGYVWAYESSGGYVTPAIDFVGTNYYTSTNCTGTVYVPTFPARYSIGINTPVNYGVRPDGVATQTLTMQSSGSPGSCSTFGATPISVIPLSSIAALSNFTPAVPGADPFHVERVQ